MYGDSLADVILDNKHNILDISDINHIVMLPETVRVFFKHPVTTHTDGRACYYINCGNEQSRKDIFDDYLTAWTAYRNHIAIKEENVKAIIASVGGETKQAVENSAVAGVEI